MALTEGECQQCQLELGKLKARYEGAGAVPEVAQARLSELETALERECSPGSSSSAAGAVVVVVGLGVLGIGFLAALAGGRQ
ncbi:unnamed protein product [marine sediment metagenome]|uniref:Uncharacterized protein n=1 Tax=marine sediment metagenome TaxID=412755 RepID=X1UCF0_9ZZZZ